MYRWDDDDINEYVRSQELAIIPDDKIAHIWDLIKIDHELWSQNIEVYEERVWVVAVFGKQVIWHDPVEGYWWIGRYYKYGHIDQHTFVGGEELIYAVYQIGLMYGLTEMD